MGSYSQDDFMHGIYQIRNVVNEHRYIGSSAQSGGMRQRWISHRSQLNRRCHGNTHLQNAWNKYGETAFIFEVILYCDSDNCLMYEQLALDHMNPEYNIAKSAKSPMLGMKHSDETKIKISNSLKGRPVSAEKCAKLSRANIGKTMPNDIKARISETIKKYHKNNPGQNSRLSVDDVTTVKAYLFLGYTHPRIARLTSIPQHSIADISCGRRWKSITPPTSIEQAKMIIGGLDDE